MPESSRNPRILSTIALAVLCFTMMILALMLSTTVVAQGITLTPTSEFDLNLPPTFGATAQFATLNPQLLPSLTGVNGQAANARVVIRSGPGRSYSSIGSLGQGKWIDIVGWNGWDEDRGCSADFEHDLDMWVQVQTGERRGWIARCVLDIRGQVTDLPIVNAAGEATLQR